MRRRVAAVASLLAAVTACGLLVDTGELVGGEAPDAQASDAGAWESAPAEAAGPDADAAPTAADGALDGGADACDAGGFFGCAGDAAPPPSCTGAFACAVVAPSGWTGPFAMYAGTPGTVPTCGAAATVLGAYAGLSAPPATCGACGCGPISTGTCGKFQLRGNSAGCNLQGAASSKDSNTCMQVSGLSYTDGDGYQAEAYSFGTAPLTGGGCAPLAASPSVTKLGPNWSTKVLGCAAAVSTPACDAGTVCAALPPPPFEPGWCVYQKGDLGSCPGSPYSVRHLYYESATDTRACGACACGAATATLCDGVATISDSVDCSSPSEAKSVPACLGGKGTKYVKVTATLPASGSCPATGGAPTGGVVEALPVTVCCTK